MILMGRILKGYYANIGLEKEFRTQLRCCCSLLLIPNVGFDRDNQLGAETAEQKRFTQLAFVFCRQVSIAIFTSGGRRPFPKRDEGYSICIPS